MANPDSPSLSLPEKRAAHAAYMREYHKRPAVHAKWLARQATYRAANKTGLAAKQLARYYDDREAILAKRQAHRDAHRDAVREAHRLAQRKWREKHRLKLRAYMREYVKLPEQRLAQIDVKGRHSFADHTVH